MSFADRVIRMRRKASLTTKSELSELESSGDPFVVASEHISLLTDVEENMIGFPRASSLYDACMRMHVLGTLNQVKKKQYGGVASRVTFGIGSALHFWIQNTGDVYGEKRRGWWKCLACGKVVGWGGPPKVKCRLCGANKEAMTYHEHFMKLTGEYLVTGHPDLFLHKEPLPRVVEMKSINGDQFDKLPAPLAQHEHQVQTYMWGCSRDKRLPVKIDTQFGYVAYISKKHASGHLPLKMFPVERSESTVTSIKIKLRAYHAGIESNGAELPEPAAECLRTNFSNSRAKWCPCRSYCTSS